ncbi:MAG TPA: CehA/McbA family metallohydrolase [Bryobacteraceae bacterium]|nr:CehA/McbA family metallohydrolase [Bryobacteraceae bacterium]
MAIKSFLLPLALAAFALPPLSAQAPHVHPADALPRVPLQPLAQQVRRLEDALSFLGQPLPARTRAAINSAIAAPDELAAVTQIETALEPFVLAVVNINGESRVKVERGPAQPALVQSGSRFFLVKIINQGNVTSALNVASPNSGRVFVPSKNDPSPKMVLTKADVRDRWADISIYNKPPMETRLSGLAVEYQILEIYSRDAGQRSADISFNVGQGTQDIGFRNDMLVLFHADAARQIKLHVLDENGKPSIASLTIRDRWNRLYPNPSKRLAPDFFFQPQIYRADGESIELPPGYYTVVATGGPEYNQHTKEFSVDAKGPDDLSFKLDRWIDPSKFGWYSGDHHVHAAGCSHYQNPAEGVLPKDMMRQISGEKLNVGAVLTWGPDYYYQKQFFSGHDDPLSLPNEKMHYDLEVSGFPSSHAGHLVLLGLKDQDYPHTRKIEDWPTWDLPILKWAKQQGAVVGFAHSGWGLQVSDRALPSFEMPGFDGIGANEYIVDVTEPDAVDFISAGDTPFVWELSIWYHTLNVGFRTRIAGETDFPCITDDRVGRGRSYVKVDGPLTYTSWLSGLKAGRSYVSDGRAHLMDFTVNGVEIGTHGSEAPLSSPGVAHATVRVAALLDSTPHPEIQSLPYDKEPYWTIERARISDSREVPVEFIVNGAVAARKQVIADGAVHDVSFDVPISRSSWVAVRILPAAHTNPIFVTVAGEPIRASRASAEWCRNAVHQCWTQKSPRIAVDQLGAARTAYDHAEEVYKKLEAECSR